MAGHSKWSKIKRQKGANDAKRGRLFTKLGNAIAIAAKAGKDPDMNPDLAMAIQQAKDENMPNANIEKAIKRGAGELDTGPIEEIRYEGYGPSGVAIIVECATDNRNRTSADVRTAFTKHGGNMAETGAVAYQFERKGVIHVEKSGDDDSDQLTAIDAGADDIIDEDDIWIIQTDMKQLHNVREALTDSGMKIKSAKLEYVPNTLVEVPEDKADKVIKLMDALDDVDDVSETYTNFDIA